MKLFIKKIIGHLKLLSNNLAIMFAGLLLFIFGIETFINTWVVNVFLLVSIHQALRFVNYLYNINKRGVK